MYNPRSSRHLPRERSSLTSLPSRQMSVVDIVQKREGDILGKTKRREEEKSITTSKDN